MRVTFASESVTEGHPDKVCDKISDSVLDAALTLDPRVRVACETMVSEDLIVITGEVSDIVLDKLDIAAIARQAIREIGYTTDSIGFCADTCKVEVYLKPQSPDISQGVSAGQGLFREQGASDQGMMFGYATKEARLNDVDTELMPTPIYFAHQLARRLAEVRKLGIIQGLYPDGKAQVAVEYENNIPVAIANLVISTHHASSLSLRDLRSLLIEHVIRPVIPDRLLSHQVMNRERDRLDSPVIFINPTGAFLVGGPKADAGLTGRKIIVDTYGGMGRHGGGAFSGKDPSKVDRSAAYMARYIAKSVVAAELADVCEVQLVYVIGHANPVNVRVETVNPSGSNDRISQAIQDVFDMRPAAIIERLNMLRPIYRATAAYGHFGRPEFPWEASNSVVELQRSLSSIDRVAVTERSHSVVSTSSESQGNTEKTLPQDEGVPSPYAAVPYETVNIELTINRDFNSFSTEEKAIVLRTLRELLNLQDEITVVDIKSGSTKLTIALPREQAEKLLWLYECGDLDKISVKDAKIIRSSTAEAIVRDKAISNAYDIFMCHNSNDKTDVKQIALRLRNRGILPWLDEWELRPGLPWQQALEEQIENIKSAAVFIGNSGIGPWHNMEMHAFIRQFVQRQCPVIPVILKTCAIEPALPTFLNGMTWVDFKKRNPNPYDQLVWGITGRKW